MAMERCVTGIAYQMRLMRLQNIDEKGRGGSPKIVRQRVRVGASDAGANQRDAQINGRVARMIKGYFEGILAPWFRVLMPASIEALKPVLGYEAQGPRKQNSRIHHHRALPRRW
jgi:hypothetical protein